jgi:hypothetical protein
MTIRIAALCGALLLGIAAGWMGAVASTAGVVPIRRGDVCVAWDTDKGRVAGQWSPAGPRCAIRDWRMSHPFHGLF